MVAGTFFFLFVLSAAVVMSRGPPPPGRPCDSMPCLNGGTCVNLPMGRLDCKCPDGWEGQVCEFPDKANFQLSYPNKAVDDYVSFNVSSSAPPLTAFTLCMWIKVGDQSDDGTLFSYSLPDQDNELLLTDYSRFKILIGGRKVTIELAANDDQWHYICATWENTAGSWNLYIDGELNDNGEDFQTGHEINSGGIVVLGQDQDEYGGGFDQEQSFFGEMYGVNLWSSVKSPEEIALMSQSCFHSGGDYLRWSDVRQAQYHGDVSVKSPTTCTP